jgi:hypothetical protein
MTDHTARPYSWEYAAANAPGLACYDCILELRARVERLEQAQQQQPEGPNLAEPLARTMEQRLPRVLHFHGVPLVPPIDCPDPMLWIAERVYEMAQQQPAPSTPAGQGELVRSVAETIVDAPSTDDPDDWTPEARAAILAVADWLASQHYLHTAADLLRREVGR